jgi:hypothetical protein
MNKKSFFLSLFFLSLKMTLFSQHHFNSQLWLGVSVKKPLSNGFSISGQYRIRRTDNISTFKGSYLYLILEKKLSKSFSVESNFRLAMIDNLLYYRYALGVEAQLKSGNHKFLLRPMVQYQKQATTVDIETSYNSKSYFRPRLTWKSDLSKKCEFYAYLEPFYKLDNNININWWQNSIGFKYEALNKLKLNPYFIWQPDYTHKLLLTNYIFGLDIEFNFKKQRKY